MATVGPGTVASPGNELELTTVMLSVFTMGIKEAPDDNQILPDRLGSSRAGGSPRRPGTPHG